MCPEHREGLLPSHWSLSSWKAQGSFLSGVTAGSTLTLHMLAPSHPAGLTGTRHGGGALEPACPVQILAPLLDSW